MPSTISNDKKKQFRTLAHDLNPIVTIAGKGLTDGVISELTRALDDHELIKVKLAVSDRDTRKHLIEALCQKTGAVVIQQIGKVAVIFKQAKTPNPKTSNIR